MQLKLADEEMSEDLSNYHTPISDFFKAPIVPDEWDQYRLSIEQIEFFHEIVLGQIYTSII